MKYRLLGNSELRVSEASLGTMTFGDEWGWGSPKAEVAETLKELREANQLSQGDIEKRTGRLRCYISRVERGHNVPSIETLGKIANALETPIYQLFYAQEKAATDPLPPSNGKKDWTSSRSGMKYLAKLTHALSRTSEAERELLLYTARWMAAASHRKRR